MNKNKNRKWTWIFKRMHYYLWSNKNMHSFKNLLLSDMRSELGLGKIIAMIIGGLVFPIVISYLSLFIGGARGGQLASLVPLFINAIVFFSFQRVVGVVRDKASVDKNKAAYLYYNKNWVLATKVINESIMFLIGFFILISVGMIGAFAWPNHFTFGEVATEAMVMLPGLFVLHIFIFMMSKWAMAFIPKRGIAIGVALGIALVLVAPVFIFNQIPETTFLRVALNRGSVLPEINTSSWFAQNQLAAIWIPYLNLGALTGINDIKVNIGGVHESIPLLKESWYIIVPIFTMIGIIAGTWRWQASAQKAYLAAS